jgi:hypothetical protein
VKTRRTCSIFGETNAFITIAGRPEELTVLRSRKAEK